MLANRTRCFNQRFLDARFLGGAPPEVLDKIPLILERFLRKAETSKSLFINAPRHRETGMPAEGEDGAEKGTPKIRLMDVLSGKKHFGGLIGALSGTVCFDRAEELGLDPGWDGVEIRVNVQLKSRMDAREHAYFAATLLTSGEVRAGAESVFESEDSLFDFLLLDQFLSAVRSALPKGYYRRYQRFERNDDHLRGSIDIDRHIRLNAMQRNGRTAYSYRENSVDNSLNRLLLCAYARLRKNIRS